MTFDAIFILYGAYVLGGVLFLIAVAHTFTAWRHGASMPLTALTSAVFISGFAFIAWLTLSALSATDWGSTFTITLPHMQLLNFSF